MSVRLYIHVASGRDWKSAFGNSMVGLTFHLATQRLGGKLSHMQFSIAAQAGIAQARKEDMDKALAGGFTHFMSLDDDMVFPMDVVDRLIAHEKPIMVANYSRKTAENTPVCLGLDGKYLDSSTKTGIEEIGFLGLGMALLDLREVVKIPSPRFDFVWDEERKEMWDESTFFSMKARDAGVSIWCDHDLSKEIGHVGDFVYQFKDLTQTFQQKEAA